MPSTTFSTLAWWLLARTDERLLGEGGTRMVCVGEVGSGGLKACICEDTGAGRYSASCCVVPHAKLARMAKKRGYSREFTPQTNRRVRFEIDRIPPTLYDAVKAKAKRQGVSLRTLTGMVSPIWFSGSVLKRVVSSAATLLFRSGSAHSAI